MSIDIDLNTEHDQITFIIAYPSNKNTKAEENEIFVENLQEGIGRKEE